MRKLLWILVLATFGRADEGTFVFELSGRLEAEDYLRFAGRYHQDSGFDKEGWAMVMNLYARRDFGYLRISPDVIEISYDGKLDAAKISALMRAMVAHARTHAVADAKARLADHQAELNAVQYKHAAARKEADRSSHAPDRGRTLEDLADRMAELRNRLADARLDKAVMEVRARYLRKVVAKHKETRRRRSDDALRLLEARRKELLNGPSDDAKNDVEELITREKLNGADSQPDEREEELIDRMIDLEIELVATEALIAQILIQTEGLERQRADALNARDFATLLNTIERFEQEAANLRRRIEQEKDLVKGLAAAISAPRRVK